MLKYIFSLHFFYAAKHGYHCIFSKRETLQNTFSLHHAVQCFFWLSYYPLPGHQLHICTIKDIFHLCLKSKKKVSALNVISVLSNDPSDRDSRGMLLEGGHWPLKPLSSGAVHALPWLASCTTGHCMQQHLGSLSGLRYTKPKYLFYQFLVFQSKDGRMAQLVGPPF